MHNKFLDNYVSFTKTTAIYPGEQTDPRVIKLLYLGNGVAGEAGEVAGKIKKLHRDGWSEELVSKLEDELGDVLWYIAQIVDILGIGLDDVINTNITKLGGRLERGTIGGSGDNR